MEKLENMQQKNMSEEELEQINGGILENAIGAGIFGPGISTGVNDDILENVTLPENLYT